MATLLRRALTGIAVAAISLALLSLASPAVAQDQRMISNQEAPLWNAVGRVNIAGNRTCTGALISPDEVITAAHCLFHPVTRRRAGPQDIRFVAGLRRDSYAALRGATAVAVLPDFVFVGMVADPDSVPFDLALIKLDRAVLPSEATPLAVADWPDSLSAVDIVGYGRDRPLIASIREDCPFLKDVAAGKLLGCAVVPGISGAPVVLAGSRSLVAVVTVRIGTWVQSNETVVIPIAPRLAALRALIAE